MGAVEHVFSVLWPSVRGWGVERVEGRSFQQNCWVRPHERAGATLRLQVARARAIGP